MKLVFLLLVGTATALASTHVNISFSQQLSSSGPKKADLLNGEAKLNRDDNNSRFERYQVDEKKANIDLEKEQRNIVSDVKANHESKSGHRSERVQNDEGAHNQQRAFYKSNQEVRQNHGQIRNLSPQDLKNMEFERYIQNYHSGPTVETVYESAKPDMQHTLTTSSMQEGSQRVVKFERQVALPAKAESVQPHPDVIKPIVSHQSSSPSSTVSLASSSSLPSLATSPSSVTTSGNGFKVNLNQKPPQVGKDGFNYDLSYNKPNYNDPNLKYNDGHFDSRFYNQVPPSIEETPASYYGNVHSHQQFGDVYHAGEQRPVVTKTIQIAQPAIKAKKYEVRHPAIQKEFYDIEERVVIKPAGTVVVELERPSAKILKEETTLPLGHPHPAVAAAYTPNRSTQSFSNIIYSNSGSPSLNHPNNQFMPHHHSTPSSVSTQPSYEKSSKEDIIESAQNKPYIGENQFPTSASADTPKAQNREIVVITDGHGNERQISPDQFTYSRDEADTNSFRTLYNNKNLYAYEDKGRTAGQNIISQQRSAIQGNDNNGEDFAFEAEYISNSGGMNLRKENKPARLQEAPLEEVVERKQQPQPIIKHEHKIVLSPSQHNIYLSRNQEVPKSKFTEEPAEVREIKPYLQNQRGPVVLYAPTRQMPELRYIPRSEYKPQSTQIAQYHSSPQISQSSVTGNRVQYSAAYAQLRHHSHEENNIEEQQRLKDIVSQSKLEKSIPESKPMAGVRVHSTKDFMEKSVPQAHIAIKIPSQSSDDANKPIFVDSAIRPMMMDGNRDHTHNAKLEISVTNNGDSKREEISSDKQKDFENIDNTTNKDSEQLSNISTKPDCVESPMSVVKENYELSPQHNTGKQQKFLRIVEGLTATSAANDAVSTVESAIAQPNQQQHNLNVNAKGSNGGGHINPPGSRVIASNTASKELAPSESFHKRRIVVNHPFQTVREVVEHEPYTNYHEVQVSEPAAPSIYHSANYYQPPGALRQSENRQHFISATYH